MAIVDSRTTDLVLAFNRLILKRGEDLASRQAVVKLINDFDPDKRLSGIFINTTDNYMIPDVAVIHHYTEHFGRWLLDPDDPDTCPWGYTVEIHGRCFDRYTPEELTAVVLHDILQNAQSDTAKIRFLRAYTEVTSRHDMDTLLDTFDDVNLSEVCFMAFTEICLRPFKVPVEGFDFVATDEVLKTMGLADAYDAYLKKALHVSNKTPEDAMEQDLKDDLRDVKTIIDACMDHDIRHYYQMIRNGVPLVTLEHILGDGKAMSGVGFRSLRVPVGRPPKRPIVEAATIMNESLNSPTDELDIRFQIDKIINSMRYMESEAERNVVLFRIKDLSMRLIKTEKKYSNGRLANDPRAQEKIKFLKECLAELDDLRKKTVKAEIRVRRWSVYAKGFMPEGYDF